jgi:hypothetical protein
MTGPTAATCPASMKCWRKWHSDSEKGALK